MSRRVIFALALAALTSAAVNAQAPRPSQSPQRPAAAAPQPVVRTAFISSMDGEFRKMDANKNGTVTRQEIEQYQRANSAAEAQARLRALFARLDTDRNGQINQAEFARLQNNNAQANAAPMLTRFDSNRDGTISLVEFRTGTLVNFDKLDVDKDGIVSASEMKSGGLNPR